MGGEPVGNERVAPWWEGAGPGREMLGPTHQTLNGECAPGPTLRWRMRAGAHLAVANARRGPPSGGSGGEPIKTASAK